MARQVLRGVGEPQVVSPSYGCGWRSIMGSQQCRIVGKSRPVLIHDSIPSSSPAPVHGGTAVSTPALPPPHRDHSLPMCGQVAGLVLHWLRVRGLARLAPSQHALLCALGQPALPESKVAARAARLLRALRGDSAPSVSTSNSGAPAPAPHGAVTGAVLDALRQLLGRLCLAAQMSGAQIGAALAPGIVSRPFPSWNRSILTEIYLCHACSCQEILRAETAGQVRRSSLAEQLEHAKTDGALTCMAYYDSLSTVAHLRRWQRAVHTALNLSGAALQPLASDDCSRSPYQPATAAYRYARPHRGQRQERVQRPPSQNHPPPLACRPRPHCTAAMFPRGRL
eukprot:COSAG01_NODE_1694_length_9467_cov_4.976196_10_plen_339_part_00